VVVADALGWEPDDISVQVSAVTAALLAAAFLLLTGRGLGEAQEALSGVVFVVAASAEIILLSFNPHGAEHLKDLLVGQILWVQVHDLIPVALVYAVILALMAAIDVERRRIVFYLLFAVAVTAS